MRKEFFNINTYDPIEDTQGPSSREVGCGIRRDRLIQREESGYGGEL